MTAGHAPQEDACPTWSELLARLTSGRDLTSGETAWAMDQIMSGAAPAVSMGAFLAALTTKGETVDEIQGLADVMLEHATETDLPRDALDIVGTGGDRLHTVNISTMSSVVIAAAGVHVVKHGNRASSSSCGSADVLEALGVRLDLPVERVVAIYGDLGITFLFANLFHPSMKYAAPVRRELGVGTAFNVLGPLTNPVRPRSGAIGVSPRRMAPLVAGVLARRGTDALVFRGRDSGLDELSTTDVNEVWEVRSGDVARREIDAVGELRLHPATVEDLRGGLPDHNAAVAREVLSGGGTTAHREAVVLNSAGGLVADGRLEGVRPEQGDLVERLRAGVTIAAETIDSGAAHDLLERWVALTKA